MRFFLLLFVLFLFFPLVSLAKIPNDPLVKQWAFEHIKAYDAWDKFIGSRRVIVAVIDNGFDTFHPDLRDNVWRNEDEIRDNGIDDDNNGYIDDVWGWNFVAEDNNPRPNVDIVDKSDDVYSHGTMVAGLIGAVGNNSEDIAGINWRVKLMNLKVLDNSGSGTALPLSKAIHYAVDNGANVINISMVSSEDGNGDIKKAVDYAYSKEVAVVAAAGNNPGLSADLDASPLYPICADAGESETKVLGVSAIKENHRIAQFSNIGSSCIDITAPGTNLRGLARYSPADGLPDRTKENWNGTSFSTALVSGAAAMMKSIHPEWGAKEIFQALLSTTQHTPGQDETVYADLFGKGLLQLDKAVAYAFEKIIRNENWLSFDKNNGEGRIKNLLTGAESAVQTSALNRIDDLAVYKNNNKTSIVTVKQLSKEKSEVSFYSTDWGLQKSFAVKMAGPLKLAFADFNNDGKSELILAPNYQSKVLFKVFSLEGHELQEERITDYHDGVFLAVADNELYTAFSSGKKLKIKKYSAGQDIEAGENSEISDIGRIAIGDIDGDGSVEIISVAKPGANPEVAVYSLSGELKRRFFAYGSPSKSGLGIYLFDYDGDGFQDMVIFDKNNDFPIKVWNHKVKNIGEWQLASNGAKTNIEFLSY